MMMHVHVTMEDSMSQIMQRRKEYTLKNVPIKFGSNNISFLKDRKRGNLKKLKILSSEYLKMHGSYQKKQIIGMR